MAISGGVMAIGAPVLGTNDGAVYLLERATTGSPWWNHTQTLVPASPDTSFGISVSVDGSHLAVGAVLANKGANAAGAVITYTRLTGGTQSWTADTLAGVEPGVTTANTRFGVAVAVSGDWLLATASLSDSTGRVFVFRGEPPPSLAPTAGSSTSTSGVGGTVVLIAAISLVVIGLAVAGLYFGLKHCGRKKVVQIESGPNFSDDDFVWDRHAARRGDETSADTTADTSATCDDTTCSTDDGWSIDDDATSCDDATSTDGLSLDSMDDDGAPVGGTTTITESVDGLSRDTLTGEGTPLDSADGYGDYGAYSDAPGAPLVANALELFAGGGGRAGASNNKAKAKKKRGFF